MTPPTLADFPQRSATPAKQGEAVVVGAPSRLHFGMLGFGAELPRQFGGVGMMVDSPRLELRVSASRRDHARGLLAERALHFAQRAREFYQLPDELCFTFEVDSAPPEHAGLGVGTQLGMAVAAGIAHLARLAPLAPEVLARAAGRALRSSVGAYGFSLGGLIVDSGHGPGEDVGALAGRFDVPEAWRVLLITPPAGAGLAGEAELAAFAKLPCTPPHVAAQLQEIAAEGIIPALKARNCQAFGDNVYEFGRLSGECFASVQGGPFASPEIEALVAWLRTNGVAGCGQSSWGPTVYAILPSGAEAQRVARALADDSQWSHLETILTAPNNRGAVLNPK